MKASATVRRSLLATDYWLLLCLSLPVDVLFNRLPKSTFWSRSGEVAYERQRRVEVGGRRARRNRRRGDVSLGRGQASGRAPACGVRGARRVRHVRGRRRGGRDAVLGPDRGRAHAPQPGTARRGRTAPHPGEGR